MEFSNRVYITFSKVFPKALIEKIKKYEEFSNIKLKPEVWAGFSLFFSILLSILLILIISIIYPKLLTLFYASIFVISWIIFLNLLLLFNLLNKAKNKRN